jgi:hypothetical protein
MKHRQKKRILTFLLTTAIILGMIAVPESLWSMVTEVKAIVQDGVFNIRNVRSGKHLDVPHSGGSGTQCIQHGFNGAANQRWRVTQQSNGLYTISPEHDTSLFLTFTGTANFSVVNVRNAASSTVASRQWRIISNGNGSYRIETSVRNQVMGIEGASLVDNARTIIYQLTANNRNDHWVFEPLITPSLRITLCQTEPHNTTQIRDHYRNAIDAIATNFGIAFHQSPSITTSTQMRGHLCRANGVVNPFPYCGQAGSLCDSSCSTLHSGHLRGANTRLINQDRVSGYFTMRIVAHAICGESDGTHRAVGGYAESASNAIRRDSIVSRRAMGDYTDFAIQHEIMHNFGAPDCQRRCIMNDVDPYVPNNMPMNVWCEPCRVEVWRFFAI